MSETEKKIQTQVEKYSQNLQKNLTDYMSQVKYQVLQDNGNVKLQLWDKIEELEKRLEGKVDAGSPEEQSLHFSAFGKDPKVAENKQEEKQTVVTVGKASFEITENNNSEVKDSGDNLNQEVKNQIFELMQKQKQQEVKLNQDLQEFQNRLIHKYKKLKHKVSQLQRTDQPMITNGQEESQIIEESQLVQQQQNPIQPKPQSKMSNKELKTVAERFQSYSRQSTLRKHNNKNSQEQQKSQATLKQEQQSRKPQQTNVSVLQESQKPSMDNDMLSQIEKMIELKFKQQSQSSLNNYAQSQIDSQSVNSHQGDKPSKSNNKTPQYAFDQQQQDNNDEFIKITSQYEEDTEDNINDKSIDTLIKDDITPTIKVQKVNQAGKDTNKSNLVSKRNNSLNKTMGRYSKNTIIGDMVSDHILPSIVRNNNQSLGPQTRTVQLSNSNSGDISADQVRDESVESESSSNLQKIKKTVSKSRERLQTLASHTLRSVQKYKAGGGVQSPPTKATQREGSEMNLATQLNWKSTSFQQSRNTANRTTVTMPLEVKFQKYDLL